MSPYLTFKIISVAILLVVMVVVLISKKSDKATGKESDDKQKNTDAIATEIKHKEWYLSDFANADFFDDSKSSDLEKKRVGSHFWIESRKAPDGVQLSLYKNNWGAEADYMMREDGFVETIITVKGIDMQRLMMLCDNAENGREVVEYIYKRFSPDGYNAYLNILQWFEENNIGVSHWSN